MIVDLRRAGPFVLMCMLLWACGSPRHRLLDETGAEGEVATALALLGELPRWSVPDACGSGHRLTGDDIRVYADVARRLRALEPGSLLEAWTLHGAWAREQPAAVAVHLTYDLYVLHRVLFALPAGAAADEARPFVSFSRSVSDFFGKPDTGGALLYPVSLDEDGAIDDISPACAHRVPVAPYDAARAFEHYRSTYGFRDPIRYAGDPTRAPSPAP